MAWFAARTFNVPVMEAGSALWPRSPLAVGVGCASFAGTSLWRSNRSNAPFACLSVSTEARKWALIPRLPLAFSIYFWKMWKLWEFLVQFVGLWIAAWKGVRAYVVKISLACRAPRIRVLFSAMWELLSWLAQWRTCYRMWRLRVSVDGEVAWKSQKLLRHLINLSFSLCFTSVTASS